MLVDAMAHSFERCLGELTPGVGEAKAKNNALSLRAIDRCALSGEVGQDDYPVGAGGRFCCFLGEHPIRGLTAGLFGGEQLGCELISKPARQGARSCYADEQTPPAGERVGATQSRSSRA